MIGVTSTSKVRFLSILPASLPVADLGTSGTVPPGPGMTMHRAAEQTDSMLEPKVGLT
jgi:hypothetical protein